MSSSGGGGGGRSFRSGGALRGGDDGSTAPRVPWAAARAATGPPRSQAAPRCLARTRRAPRPPAHAPVLGAGGHQVVAAAQRVVQELLGHLRAHGVRAVVLQGAGQGRAGQEAGPRRSGGGGRERRKASRRSTQAGCRRFAAGQAGPPAGRPVTEARPTPLAKLASRAHHGPGVAAPITVEARHGAGAAHLQLPAVHVARPRRLRLAAVAGGERRARKPASARVDGGGGGRGRQQQRLQRQARHGGGRRAQHGCTRAAAAPAA